MKAFPKNIYDSTKPDGYHDGMDLRDYFAAKAMNGLITIHDQIVPDEGLSRKEAIARMSYGMADEMIKARDYEPKVL